MSSSQLTFIFFRGVAQPPTSIFQLITVTMEVSQVLWIPQVTTSIVFVQYDIRKMLIHDSADLWSP